MSDTDPMSDTGFFTSDFTAEFINPLSQIPDESKRKVYLDKSFIKSVRTNHAGKAFDKKALEKVHRQYYYDNFKNYPWLYQKVYYHPDVTTTDWEFLHGRVQWIPSSLG